MAWNPQLTSLIGFVCEDGSLHMADAKLQVILKDTAGAAADQPVAPAAIQFSWNGSSPKCSIRYATPLQDRNGVLADSIWADLLLPQAKILPLIPQVSTLLTSNHQD